MRTVIYCRVSTEDQEKEGTSLQSQLEGCHNKGHELGSDIPKEFTILETGSGLTLDRPGLDRLRQWVRNKEVDAIIAYSLDRLSRDPIHLIILQEELERAGVELILVTETIDSSDLGKLITYIRGYAAKLEVEKIRERTTRGKLSSAFSTAGERNACEGIADCKPTESSAECGFIIAYRSTKDVNSKRSSQQIEGSSTNSLSVDIRWQARGH